MAKTTSKLRGEWKKDYAVEMYKTGKFSFGQAAKFAEISVWDFPNILKEKKVSLNIDLEELESDIETIME